MPEQYTSTSAFRFIAYEKATNRMELNGIFTADDLRKCADWLDIPVKGEGNWINIKLSPIKPDAPAH